MPSTPGRPSAVTSRSSRPRRSAIAIGSLPERSAPRAGWSAATRNSVPRSEISRSGRFDGIMTVCVFAWEERARESSVFMRETIDNYIKSWD